MNWFRRCARLGAAVGLVAVAAVACGGDSGDDGNANFTDRPGQNAPTDPGSSDSTVTTTDRGGMGSTGDDTGGQVKN